MQIDTRRLIVMMAISCCCVMAVFAQDATQDVGQEDSTTTRKRYAKVKSAMTVAEPAKAPAKQRPTLKKTEPKKKSEPQAQPTNETADQKTTQKPTLTTDMIEVDQTPVVVSEPQFFPEDFYLRLLQAMESRIGTPYQYNGKEDGGYDCSGFVWRVFQDAGMGFTRLSARAYWDSFPEATEDERDMFGTLVFFNDLGHVGVVRDNASFYHASTSQGVILSSLSGYWGKRVIGYRRVPNTPAIFASLSDSGQFVQRTEPLTFTHRGKKGTAAER